MANMTAPLALPPLPSYTLSPRPSLVPYIEDKYLSLLLPIIAYWAFSMLFHIIDTRDYFPQYRLHTPAEVLKRNHVSRYEVVRDVIIQQAVQTIVGVVLTIFDEDELTGKDAYNVAVWAQRTRLAQTAIPTILALVGLDAQALALKASERSPSLAGALAGGTYTLTAMSGKGSVEPAFAAWEFAFAKLIYWVLIPALRFGLAILFVDTWQYFLHRAMHMNKWLYSMHILPFKPNPPKANTNTPQQHSTPATTASTSPTPTAPSTTTPSKASSSTPSAPASPTSQPACHPAKPSASSPAALSKPSTITAATLSHGTLSNI